MKMEEMLVLNIIEKIQEKAEDLFQDIQLQKEYGQWTEINYSEIRYCIISNTCKTSHYLLDLDKGTISELQTFKFDSNKIKCLSKDQINEITKHNQIIMDTLNNAKK